MGPGLISSSSLTNFSVGFIPVNILIRKMVVTTKSKSLPGQCAPDSNRRDEFQPDVPILDRLDFD